MPSFSSQIHVPHVHSAVVDGQRHEDRYTRSGSNKEESEQKPDSSVISGVSDGKGDGTGSGDGDGSGEGDGSGDGNASNGEGEGSTRTQQEPKPEGRLEAHAWASAQYASVMFGRASM